MSFRLHPIAAAILLGSALSSAIAYADEPTVVVTATRYPSRLNELVADVSVIDRAQLDQQDPSAPLGEVLGRVAGVEFSRAGGRGSSESIYVRGTNTGHVLVLIDGIRTGSATLGYSEMSVMPIAQIERVEIVRGTASAIYGSDAIGGVINIITRAGGDAPKFQATVGGGNYGSYETDVAHAGKVGGLRYALRAGWAGTEGINATANRNSAAYNADKDGYRNHNASGQVSYRFNDGSEVGASFLESFKFNRYDSSYPSAASDWRTQQYMSTAAVYGTWRILPVWQSTLRLGQSQDHSVTRPSSTAGQEKDSYQTVQDQLTWQNDVTLPLGRLLGVVERLHQKIESTARFTSYARTVNSVALGWNGTYGNHLWQTNVRHDANSQYGGRQTETLGYGYQFAQNWRANASYGTAFKAPSFNDLYYPNTPFSGVGNPNLKPEFARNREAAVHYEQGAHRASLTYFHNNISNLIQWEETSPGSFFYTPTNVGQARITGWTADYNGRFGAWSLYGNLTVQDPENAMTHKTLIRRAREFGTIGGSYEAGVWQAGLELKASGARYDDAANTRRLGGYGVVNVHGKYRLSNDLSLFGRVDNLFDRRYDYARTSSVNYGNLGTTFFVGLRYTLQ